MRLRTRTTISCVITGDDLAVAAVRLGASLVKPSGTVLAEALLTGFVSMEQSQRAAALADVINAASGSAQVILTIPSSWCAMHPIAMTGAQWTKARTEVLRSIDRMLPLSPDDAEVGLLDRAEPNANPGDPATAGMLVGAARSRIEPWLDALAEALGRPVDSVRSPQMAALGLGLHHEESTQVIEHDGATHTLRWGRLISIDELPTANAGEQHRKTLQLSDNPSDAQGGPIAIAIAAALADVVAPGSFCPITGSAPAPTRRWLAPAACVAIAAGMFMLASVTGQSRYERAIAAEQGKQSQMTDDLDKVQRLRNETERLTRLYNEGYAATVRDWSSMAPALIEAQASLPEDGTIHRLSLDRESVAFRGQAGSSGAALRALEASGAFTSASYTAPISKSPDGDDLFELRADRTAPASGGADE